MDWTTLTNLMSQPEFLIGLLVGFLLAVVVAVVLKALRRPADTFEAFANESGKVLVSKQALQEQIQRCCEEIGDIGKVRAKVIQKNGVVLTRIRMRMRSNAKLSGISGYLQQQIGSVLQRNLGVENIGPIDIVVTGILPSSEEPAAKIKPEEKTPE